MRKAEWDNKLNKERKEKNLKSYFIDVEGTFRVNCFPDYFIRIKSLLQVQYS